MSARRIVDMMVDRLAEIAAGAPLEDSIFGPAGEFGICFQIKQHFKKAGRLKAGWEAERVLSEYFIHMGLHKRDPLGDFDLCGDRWAGKRGQRRRRLCYDLTVQLIASAGYRGKYQ